VLGGHLGVIVAAEHDEAAGVQGDGHIHPVHLGLLVLLGSAGSLVDNLASNHPEGHVYMTLTGLACALRLRGGVGEFSRLNINCFLAKPSLSPAPGHALHDRQPHGGPASDSGPGLPGAVARPRAHCCLASLVYRQYMAVAIKNFVNIYL
jgi:hypothetical protein